MRDSACTDFLQWALPRLRLRWRGFRRVRGQVCKRIRHRICALGLADFRQYRAFLEATPQEWLRLERMCRITISRFFRDRAAFDRLESEVFPHLLSLASDRGEGQLRCWSCGCAAGEEPYSLQLVWRLGRFPQLRRVGLKVLGTDVDDHLLERAGRARYSASSLREVPPGWISSAFERQGEEFSLRPRFRQGVVFALQDVRRELPREKFHLILCRNLVFTYLEEDLQAETLSRILSRLVPGGFLVLGAQECLPSGRWPLERIDASQTIYRRSQAESP